MAKTYRPYVPEQDLLLPPSLRDWLPEGHLAFFVSDLVEQLDLSAILREYEDDERGYPPYHPPQQATPRTPPGPPVDLRKPETDRDGDQGV